MQFNFQQIIEALNAGLPASDNFAFAMARATVVPNEYVLNQILPNENRPDYHIDGGSMTIYPTMLGQAPMDSPYPPMGAMSSSQFFENTTKIAGQMFFPEKAQRDLQAWEKTLIMMGFNDGRSAGDINGTLTLDANGNPNMDTINGRRLNALLGLSRTMLKAHWDTQEWLKGQGLCFGAINWTYNKIPLVVDYKIPAANKRTRAGAAAYNSTTGGSMFWTDMRWLTTMLSDFRIIMNSRTYYSIIDNEKNNIRVVVNEGMNREIVKIVGTTEQSSPDQRDRVRITLYDKSGTVINAKTGALESLPFIPDGKIIVVGNTQADGFELIQGSVADPANNYRLGYTHIAPTVEGGGRPGIWARIYTPEQKPMQVMAETAVNELPVILNGKKLIILTTDI